MKKDNFNDLLKTEVTIIINEEFKENTPDLFIGTKKELITFLSNILSKEDLEIFKEKSKNTNGYYDFKRNIFIIFTSESINQNKKLAEAIQTTYHEIRHIQQKNFSKSSLYGHICEIEHQFDLELYALNHDHLLFEIDANLYAIRKTKELLQQKFKTAYKSEKKNLEEIEKNYSLDYFIYNPTNTIYYYIKTKQKEYQSYLNNTIQIPPTLNEVSAIFLKENFEYKNLDDILKNKKLAQIEKEMIYAYLGNPLFIEKLNQDEQKEDLVAQAILHNKITLKNQSTYLENHFENKATPKKKVLKKEKK